MDQITEEGIACSDKPIENDHQLCSAPQLFGDLQLIV